MVPSFNVHVAEATVRGSFVLPLVSVRVTVTSVSVWVPLFVQVEQRVEASSGSE